MPYTESKSEKDVCAKVIHIQPREFDVQKTYVARSSHTAYDQFIISAQRMYVTTNCHIQPVDQFFAKAVCSNM